VSSPPLLASNDCSRSDRQSILYFEVLTTKIYLLFTIACFFPSSQTLNFISNLSRFEGLFPSSFKVPIIAVPSSSTSSIACIRFVVVWRVKTDQAVLEHPLIGLWPVHAGSCDEQGLNDPGRICNCDQAQNKLGIQVGRVSLT